ncbi:MAG: flagellar basal-body rod protein FlgG [Bdellovibrionaceae bacterium]|nr:flagellar basal-body rod protein FlgG [Pseudobdellovibrionaceae bacterium]|tara:strand:+ start:45119 stop:45904 length:786 start_codon:yes stop_codon:yes gene_type:complete
MLKSLNTAATGMQAQQSNMDVIANNIANSSTTGFKKARAEFEDLLYHTEKEPGAATGLNSVSPTGVQIGSGVKTAAVNKDFIQGSTQVTKNPFDMEIQGPGFFPIQLPNGQIGYTRDGTFKKGPGGALVNKNGNLLQPEIVIPPDAVGVEIGQNGTVQVITGLTGGPQNVGQVQLVNFINPAGLKSIGNNLFVPSQSSGVPQQGAPGQNGLGYIAQGQLERSNVNIVDEMVNMISAQRSYETNSKVIQASDQMLQQINNLR